MAATPGKFEKVVVRYVYLQDLERSYRMLVHLMTPILRFREDIILKLEKCYRKRPSALADFSRSEIEAAKSVINASIPIIHDLSGFEPYAPPSDCPEIRRLEKKAQELEEAAAELKRVNEWLARNANRIASALAGVTQTNINGLGLGGAGVTADLAFLQYLNELKIKK